MSLFEQWQEKLQNQNNDIKTREFWTTTFQKRLRPIKIFWEITPRFWKAAYRTLPKQYDMDEITFTGFLDGINTSLESEIDLQDLTSESELN